MFVVVAPASAVVVVVVALVVVVVVVVPRVVGRVQTCSCATCDPSGSSLPVWWPLARCRRCRWLLRTG